ncbi:hypothetical protein BAE46_10360 [Glaciecola punicea]|jgi:fimbrial chaperone protein|uniref:fimbrial biogenesis chaperone n=1 Tax=Glaciecola punicea TaxID=56804 RepID=UPI0008726DE5|nr:fimbria/pilus periplasmic chaperone [Glaciecola punicea]OFA30615.1 hypothetical protein BAE46_10360 [Glaciecola punicea]
MTVSTNFILKSKKLYLLAIIVIGNLLSSSAWAVIISPVKVELSPIHSVVTVTVSNDSDSPLILQSEVLAWTQANGEDLLEESTDLLVAPTIAKIEAEGVQIFRVTLRHPTVAVAERAYRLVLDDVSNIEGQRKGDGINLLFSHRLPVFVAGTGKVGPRPHFESCANSAQRGCVRLVNDGDQYVQVQSLIVNGINWKENLDAGNRVLAGAWKQWTFASPPASAGQLTVTAETSDGQMTFELANPSR